MRKQGSDMCTRKRAAVHTKARSKLYKEAASMLAPASIVGRLSRPRVRDYTGVRLRPLDYSAGTQSIVLPRSGSGVRD